MSQQIVSPIKERQTSVVNSSRSRRYRGMERPKMDCRVPTPLRSAFGESGFRGRETV